jgi:hypothetical protein
MLTSGKFRYCAPEGYHDDCVISLGLANWGVEHLILEESKNVW